MPFKIGATEFKTGGELRRDYTYVKDCVSGIICALRAEDKKLNQRVYLTASGEIFSGSQVAKMVRDVISNAVIEFSQP